MAATPSQPEKQQVHYVILTKKIPEREADLEHWLDELFCNRYLNFLYIKKLTVLTIQAKSPYPE